MLRCIDAFLAPSIHRSEREGCMSYFVRSWLGVTSRELPSAQFGEVIDQLRQADEEHGSAALEHESGWTLSYGRNGTLIFEQVDSDDPAHRFHQVGVSAAYVLSLWELLANGAVEG
jgi:hypothetical protein